MTTTDSLSSVSTQRTEFQDEAAKKVAEYQENDLPELEQVSPEAPLDGGYGWFVVFGTFLVQVTSFGTASSWGVFQDYLEVNVFKNVPNAQFQLSFAGTLLEVFVNLMGPAAQLIASRFGSKSVLIIGTVLATLGLELASLSTEVWHLYLTAGVLFGAGASLLYVTAMGIAPLWFNKKRGLALGLGSSGSGLGGLVFPFIINAINSSLGVQWSFRILGFICLFCDVLACFFIKERTKRPITKSLKKVFDLSVFKDVNFLLWMCGSVISLMGYFIPYFFIPSNATYLGLSPSQGSALIAVMSACNFCGRVLVGYIGDRIGRLNADIIFTFCCALSSLLVWTFAKSYGVLMAFSALFGLFCGSYFAMMTPITAAILTPDQYLTGVSTVMLFNIISNFGITIASALETNLHAEPYLAYKMFTGVTYLVGGIILVVLKYKIAGGFLKKF